MPSSSSARWRCQSALPPDWKYIVDITPQVITGKHKYVRFAMSFCIENLLNQASVLQTQGMFFMPNTVA